MVVLISQTGPAVYAEPERCVTVKEMADSSINLVLRVRAPIDQYWDVVWDANKKVKEGIEAKGLTIPFSQRDGYMIA